MVKLKIDTSGTAFEDPFFDEINDIARQIEVARILRELANELTLSAEFGKTIADNTGKRVGEFRMR